MRLDDRDFDDLEVEDIETVKKRIEQKKRKKGRKGSSLSPAIIPVLGVLIIIVTIIGINVGRSTLENRNIKVTADLKELFGGMGVEEAGIILNSEYVKETRSYMDGDKVYLPYDFVKSELNDWFYHDENEDLVLYTTPDGTDSIAEGSDTKEFNGIFCLSTDVVKKYTDIDIDTFPDGSTRYILIRNRFGKYSGASALKKTAVRVSGDKKSDILAVLDENDNVRVLDAGNQWSAIQTNDGLIGYVLSKDLTDYKDESDTAPGRVPEMVFPSTNFNQKIVLGWHQVMNSTANNSVYDILAKDTGLNVLSPTWYSLTDQAGNMTDHSSADYVQAAHDAGKQVWSVIDNFNTEGFIPDQDTHEVLSYTSKRKALIDTLVASVTASGADGINVDFEKLSADTGQHFAQFIKELSLASHKAGLILSVDNYVPEAYSQHYHREVQGRVCDFCVIMGYDEYNASSTEAGPVASLDFVENGIEKTLLDVDPSKVINGLPFFTRIWETENGIVKSTQALGMTEASDTFKAHNVTPSWDDGAGCNYGEYESNGHLFRMWLEDNESMNAKLSVMDSYKLAGAAFWKLGLENSEVWPDIKAYGGR